MWIFGMKVCIPSGNPALEQLGLFSTPGYYFFDKTLKKSFRCCGGVVHTQEQKVSDVKASGYDDDDDIHFLPPKKKNFHSRKKCSQAMFLCM
jgi:hypothetical protein